MKIGGKTLTLSPVTFEIERDGSLITFTLAPVTDFTELRVLCPAPTPPTVFIQGGKQAYDLKAPEYLKELEKYNEQVGQYILIKSLMATKDLEFALVRLEDPSTWHLLQQELNESGLTAIDQSNLMDAFKRANGISKSGLDEARERFLEIKQA